MDRFYKIDLKFSLKYREQIRLPRKYMRQYTYCVSVRVKLESASANTCFLYHKKKTHNGKFINAERMIIIIIIIILLNGF